MNSKVFFILLLIFNSVLFGQKTYSIKGKVTDALDKDPLIGVSILVAEAKMGTISNENGDFTINGIRKGTYQLRFSYIGHSTKFLKVTVPSEESQNIQVQLSETAIHLNDIVITGNPFVSEDAGLVKPLVSLSNLSLDIVRNNSIGEMLNYQAGVSVVSNGTAVSRPVIRGFGSNRVVILEDGLRMGDLSGSSSDHSVTEDGSNPDKIEIIRGASSLLYSSSSPGGIINIITDLIPSSIPSKLNGSVSFGGNSVSEQKFANTELLYGHERLSYDLGAFYRIGNSYRTPSGSRVPNSDLRSDGLRAGMSYHPEWGTLGIGINTMANKYGIPYNINSVDAEGPVFIDMKKTDVKGLFELDTLSDLIRQISVKGGYESYGHSEISRLSGETGSRFSLSTVTGDIFVKHNLFTSAPYINNAFGLWGINQKYKVRGEEALTPDANLTGLAFYLFEQLDLYPLNLQGAVRFEYNDINMPQAILSDSLFPAQNKRYFNTSYSLSGTFNVLKNLSLYTSFSNQMRVPSVEELGSYSIHPAMGSFDIGNKSLEVEKNYGFEMGTRLEEKSFFLELNGYYNYINNYIFRNPSSLFYQNGIFSGTTGTPVYFYTQTNSEIYGAEFMGITDITDGLSVTITSDYVVGKYKNIDKNLPLIPPFRLTIEPKYVKDYYWFGLLWKGAAAQNKTAENETTTKGFGVLDIYGGIKLFTGSLIHQFDLKIENVANQEYREHLSALKNFAPMPGRNILLTYKMLF